jgi:putative flavoprotein involved in K+ transport
VLERGEVANSWRRERWDSLRLLTPNWQSRLPGLRYDGADQDGYMTMPEVIAFIERFAVSSGAPVRTGVNVELVRRTDDGYQVVTSSGEIRCRTLVIASGACNQPAVPRLSAAVPDSVEQFTTFGYRDPAKLPDGGVLVVGASATGVQLAAELHRSGRPVTLSVGEHVRLPRTYRGRDVLWWMDASGVWDQRYDEIDDLTRARRLPSPQLVGTAERITLDLNALTSMGVALVGRWAAVRDGQALFSGGLRNVFSLADLKLNRLLGTFDEWAEANGPGAGASAGVGPPERFEPTRVPGSARLQLDLRSGEIRSVVWATGFRPDYGWLDVPVVDAKGHLRHEGGVTDSPGLYALGLPVLRRRKSTFIYGIEDDARQVIDHLAGYLAVSLGLARVRGVLAGLRLGRRGPTTARRGRLSTCSGTAWGLHGPGNPGRPHRLSARATRTSLFQPITLRRALMNDWPFGVPRPVMLS